MTQQQWAEVTLSVGLGIVTYVVLWLVYRQVYRIKKWESPAIRAFVDRTRLYVYLTLITFAAWVIAMVPNSLYQGPAWYWLTVVLMVLITIVIIESFLSAIFDFVLPYRKQVDIPTIFRDLLRVILYLMATLIFLKFMFNMDVTPLITGSAIVSVVIGLALQESLGNLFSGIFLHGAKPFSRGDWIAVGSREGVVEKVDWRSTTVRTQNADYVVIPNSSLAKEVITNYSAPTRSHARVLKVGVHYRHSPAKVRKILIDAALKTERVSAEPRPVSRVIEFADSAVVYDIKFWITDFEQYPNIQGAVMERVWYHFRREGIEIPFPIRTVIMQQSGEPVEVEKANMKLLKRIDFLAELGEEEMKYLSSRLRVLTYTAGEPIIRQGEQGNSFYVVRDGKVQVQARDAEGRIFFKKDLAAGDFFGEISLLTGDPRNATVVALEESELLRLDKEAFRKIIEDNPRSCEIISTVLARRQETSAEKQAAELSRADARAEQDRANSTRQQFLQKIRDFFAY